jgi:hypothetical protein
MCSAPALPLGRWQTIASQACICADTKMFTRSSTSAIFHDGAPESRHSSKKTDDSAPKIPHSNIEAASLTAHLDNPGIARMECFHGREVTFKQHDAFQKSVRKHTMVPGT